VVKELKTEPIRDILNYKTNWIQPVNRIQIGRMNEAPNARWLLLLLYVLGYESIYFLGIDVDELHDILFAHEEYSLLGYKAVYFVESQPTFRKNISPPSSG
jgi:hypothetical protein